MDELRLALRRILSVIRKELLAEDLSDFQTFCRGYEILCMETNYMMGAHPSGIFLPELFLIQKCLIYISYSNTALVKRPLKCYISFSDFSILEDISDEGSHCAVRFCRAVNDLIDCHISSHSSYNIVVVVRYLTTS